MSFTYMTHTLYKIILGNISRLCFAFWGIAAKYTVCSLLSEVYLCGGFEITLEYVCKFESILSRTTIFAVGNAIVLRCIQFTLFPDKVKLCPTVLRS